VLNKGGRFGAEIFVYYTDIVIFVLGYFIPTHPVYAVIVYNIIFV